MSRIFAAIDTIDHERARALAGLLADKVGGVKLGLEFYLANGPAGVLSVLPPRAPLFLDLKLHDIPNTVAGGVNAVAQLSPTFLTVHAAGGSDMLRAARDAADDAAARTGRPRMRLLAVTVLTSLDDGDLAAVGQRGPVADQVRRLAALARDAGMDGVVCAPHEVAALRADLGPDMVLMVPGIRPAWAVAGDQKRIMTPAQAIAAGADYLVVGRPITGAGDPAEAAARINAELA